jgi:molybdopterin converting factor small subunit
MASKKKSKAATKFVSFQALGNTEVRVALNSKNRTLGQFIKQNIPPAWNLQNFALRVNDRTVAMDYTLNDGDRISAAPNVAGGERK